MLAAHTSQSDTNASTMLTTEIDSPKQTLGCLVVDEKTSKIRHFVEKPEDFLATHINCGVYLLNTEELFKVVRVRHFEDEQNSDGAQATPFITLERDVFPGFVASERLLSHCLETRPGATHWAQIKSATSALNANRLALASFKNTVFIHENANVSEDASIGPNVSIGDGCEIGAGVRIRDSIILSGC